jgi:two-component sensor histidine kinase
MILGFNEGPATPERNQHVPDPKMSPLDWFSFVWGICSSGDAPVYWREAAVLSNLAVAAAYFWLPAVMAVVWRRWRTELPFPWIWVGFTLFIAACGTSHIVHAMHAIQEVVPYTYPKLAVLILTAVISLTTAAGFTFVLPGVLQFTSPAAVRERLEEEVRKATSDLEEALAHERLLLQEVHHRVKNNLQVTASLVSLHIRRIPTYQRAELEALRSRIAAMADVHAQLQQVGARAFSVQSFTRDLCERLRVSFGRERVTCVIQGSDFTVPLDLATSLALILNEVVSNALMHGYQPGETGTITIETSVEDNRRTVVIEDRGRGASGPIEGGIGSMLIASLGVQLGAQTEYGARPEGGTRFKLTFAEPHPLHSPKGPYPY